MLKIFGLKVNEFKSYQLSNCENKNRSFIAKSFGSVDQRAAKLLAVKVGGLKKKSAGRPWPHSNHSARVRERLVSNHS